MRKIPKLRFKEFSDEWKEKKLGDILEFKNGVNASKEQYGKGIKFINVLDILNNDFITYDNIIGKVDIDDNTLEKYSVTYGDILFQRSSETREEVGMANVYLDKKNIATFGGFVIRGKKIGEYIPIFLNKLLKTNLARNEITSKSGGSTRYNVGQETLKDVRLLFPILQEQEKIANFLSSIDKKISLTEEKLELFRDYKKGVMQKIFSQELRFKDSNGNDYPEWEEKRLGDILIKNKEKNKNNQYILVQSISNKYGFVNQEEYFEDRKIASNNLSNYYIVKNKNFAYNPSRINVGSLAYKKDFSISVISPLYVSFYADNIYVNDIFLLNWFFSLPFYKQMSSSFEGSVRNNLSYDTLSNFNILLPILEEQQKIVDFLSSIDTKIENIEKELEGLKEFKRGLLQQMFV